MYGLNPFSPSISPFPSTHIEQNKCLIFKDIKMIVNGATNKTKSKWYPIEISCSPLLKIHTGLFHVLLVICYMGYKIIWSKKVPQS